MLDDKNKNILLKLLLEEARSLATFNYLVSYTLTTRDKQLDQQERWRKHILKATKEMILYYKLEQQATNNLIELPSVMASNYEGLFLLNVNVTSNKCTGFIYTFTNYKNDKKEKKEIYKNDKKEKKEIIIYIYKEGELIQTMVVKEGSKAYELVFEYRKLFEKQLVGMRERINTMQYKLLLNIMYLIKKYLNE